MSISDENHHPEAPHHFPLAGGADDGWSTEDEATATCYCGGVQLSFPTRGPGLVDVFVCNCFDCRKITASMFATGIIVRDACVRHLRGREMLKTYAQEKTIASGHRVTNHFCSTCGSLMYRTSTGLPGHSALRLGTVDDVALHETRLKPRVEQYVKDRVGWLRGAEGARQVLGSAYS
ncbi:Mss4-like protein [Daldinia caldariorum]|uniref:Mss4-like protein n=1 Tax=Daldinia caldariorum TaxID=326644 RepID=UPI0020086669|nr:Mss4-like protein [Daldinia caldariorum]KAI1472764.1 Mss4-like protein [Daldinia caldariorum]